MVAAAQGVVLAVAAAGVLPRPLATVAGGGALALLVESFGRDVAWLWRHRPVAAPAPRHRPARGRPQVTVPRAAVSHVAIPHVAVRHIAGRRVAAPRVSGSPSPGPLPVAAAAEPPRPGATAHQPV